MAGKLSNKSAPAATADRPAEGRRGALRQNALRGGLDRYMAAIYEERAIPLEYLASDAMVCICDSARVMEHLKNVLWQVKEDVEALLKAGVLCGEWAGLTATTEELWSTLADRPVYMLASLPTSRYPFPPVRCCS